MEAPVGVETVHTSYVRPSNVHSYKLEKSKLIYCSSLNIMIESNSVNPGILCQFTFFIF